MAYWQRSIVSSAPLVISGWAQRASLMTVTRADQTQRMTWRSSTWLAKKSIVSSSSAGARFDDNRPWWRLWNASVKCNLNHDRKMYFLASYFLKIDNSYKTYKVKLHTVRKSDTLTYFLTKRKTAQLLITWEIQIPGLLMHFYAEILSIKKHGSKQSSRSPIRQKGTL